MTKAKTMQSNSGVIITCSDYKKRFKRVIEQFAGHNFVPLLLHYKDKKPIMKWENVDLSNYHKNIKIESGKNYNLGIITGRKSDLFVVDLDTTANKKCSEHVGTTNTCDKCLKMQNSKHDGVKYFTELMMQHEPAYDKLEDLTLVQTSGSGGKHLFFRYNERLDIIANRSDIATHADGKKIAIDVRSNGGYITVWPSVHPNGVQYKFNKDIERGVIEEVPDWLYEWLKDCMQKVKPIRNRATTTVTNRIATDDEIYELFYKLNKDRWDIRDNWLHMMICLSNLSDKAGDPNKYYDLMQELSQTSAAYYDADTEYTMQNTWHDRIKRDISIKLGTAYLWLKEDVSLYEYETFRIKHMVKNIKFNHNITFFDFQKLKNKHWINDRDEIYEYFNSCAFKIHNGGAATYATKNVNYLVDTEEKKETVKETKLIYLKDITSFHDCDIFYDTKDKKGKIIQKKITLYEVFKDYTKHVSYSNVNFVPYSAKGKVPDCINLNKTLNMFTGFVNDYNANYIVNEDKLNPILYHIRTLVAFDDKVYDYFIKWLAHFVQKPNIKIGVATLFKSKQGTGKSMFFDWFGNKVLGRQYYDSIKNAEIILGKFNSLVMAKLLIVCDEVMWEGDHENNDRIKHAITQSVQHVEQKGLEVIKIDDFCNYAFLTNKDNAIRIEPSDRRFLCCEPSEINIGNIEYFDRLLEIFADVDYAVNFYHYLLSLNITNWKPSAIPMTNSKLEAIQRSLHIVDKFLVDVIYNIFETSGRADYNVDGLKLTNQEIWAMYNTFAKERNNHVIKSSIELGKKLAAVGIEEYRSSSVRGRIFFYTKLEKYFNDALIIYQ